MPRGWHVGGIGMGCGECPEFVCLGEGQGVPRRCMIHHGLSRGIFTPWPWVGPLGQREAFFASQHPVSGRQAPQAWHSGGPLWMGHVRRGLSLDFPPLPKLANLLLQLCLLQVQETWERAPSLVLSHLRDGTTQGRGVWRRGQAAEAPGQRPLTHALPPASVHRHRYEAAAPSQSRDPPGYAPPPLPGLSSGAG